VLHQTKQAGVNGMYDFVAVPQRGLALDDVVITEWDAGAGKWRLMSQPAGAPLTQ
jgi:branched-chain amino acid transport system substrate-binding protein